MTAPARHIVFYDGECGVCHWAVAFILARDAAHRFDFAPLQGETFASSVPASDRARLPDSMFVLSPDGTLLQRSRAVAAILRGLGAAWPALGLLVRLLPRPLADAAYDAFARRRKRFAPAPGSACPLVAPELRTRFLP